MKKMLAIIIVLIIIIIILVGNILYLIGNNAYNVSKNKLEDNNLIDEPYILDGPDSVQDIMFFGHTFEEIQEYIEVYYGNYYGIYDVSANCYYDQNNIFRAIVATEYEIVAEYYFDTETGKAINKDTGETVDFFELDRQGQRIQANVEFTDNECIAIGYVTDLNETKFIDKYFPNGEYGQLTYYDFRSPVYQNQSGYGNKFVIIPINGDVNITVYDAYLGEDGDLYTDNVLIQSVSEPFILLDDYIEYVPSMCVKFEYNGFEEMFPITFSGEDGKLDLKGYEMEVKDISLY